MRDAGAVTEALGQVWPMFETALQQNISNAVAVERLCRTPRYALRSAGKLAGTGTVVSTLLTALPQWFAAAPHSCFLYLASELVKIFGNVPRQEGPLGKQLAHLSRLHTFCCLTFAPCTSLLSCLVALRKAALLGLPVAWPVSLCTPDAHDRLPCIIYHHLAAGLAVRLLNISSSCALLRA